MAINANTAASPAAFGTTFGAKSQPKNQTEDRPKAKFWMNIGVPADVVLEDEDEARFISLPVGIPLDTQERLPTNSRNDTFSAFQSARNNLLDQIMAFAENLAPGEEAIMPLQVQLRRVSEEQAPIAPENNAFAVKLNLVR